MNEETGGAPRPGTRPTSQSLYTVTVAEYDSSGITGPATRRFLNLHNYWLHLDMAQKQRILASSDSVIGSVGIP